MLYAVKCTKLCLNTSEPFCAAGEVRTQALTVAADAALLQAIATVAAAVLPPPDFQLPKPGKASRSATPGSSRRSRSTKKQPALLLSNAVVAFYVGAVLLSRAVHDALSAHNLSFQPTLSADSTPRVFSHDVLLCTIKLVNLSESW